MRQSNYFFIYFLVAGLFLQSRDVPVKSDTYTVYINFENYSVRANVLYDAGKLKAKMGHMYYWYVNNSIKNTDGSFDGKLLHGEYKSFFLDMGLKEQGNFRYGLKDGIWKSWFRDGKIQEVMNYKKGKEQGIQELYNEQGKLVSKTNYKNGARDGKMILYRDNKMDSVIIYKNGEVKIQKKSKINKGTKEKQQTSPAKAGTKIVSPKDTTAKTPKSSIKLKKIFNKAEKNKSATQPAEQKKPEEKKKPALEKKKSKAPVDKPANKP